MEMYFNWLLAAIGGHLIACALVYFFNEEEVKDYMKFGFLVCLIPWISVMASGYLIFGVLANAFEKAKNK